MTLQKLGELTLGESFPAGATAAATVSASTGIALADAQAKLASLSLIGPIPTLAASLENAKLFVTKFIEGLPFMPPEPHEDLQAQQVQAWKAQLEPLIAQLQVQLAFASALSLALESAGVHLYKYEGPAAQFGNELQAELGDGAPGIAPGDPAMALVLATTLPETWAAMKMVFKTAETEP